MKKYKLLFALSFVPYLPLGYAIPYFGGYLGANIVVWIFIVALLYQLTYLFYFRKNDRISFGRAFANYILGLSILGDIIVIYTYVNAFFNGYVWSFLTFVSERYFGIEAWKAMAWESIILIPLLSLSVIYQIVFFIIWRKTRKL